MPYTVKINLYNQEIVTPEASGSVAQTGSFRAYSFVTSIVTPTSSLVIPTSGSVSGSKSGSISFETIYSKYIMMSGSQLKTEIKKHYTYSNTINEKLTILGVEVPDATLVSPTSSLVYDVTTLYTPVTSSRTTSGSVSGSR